MSCNEICVVYLAKCIVSDCQFNKEALADYGY